MSETNNNCLTIKHHYKKDGEVIYCEHCGDVKSLVLPIPSTKQPAKPGPFDFAKKYMLKHGQFPRDCKEESKVLLEKLFSELSNEKNIILIPDEQNTEVYAMLCAVILVTNGGGYSIKVTTNASNFRQRVEFHLARVFSSGMRCDVKTGRCEVLMSGGKSANTLYISPVPTMSDPIPEKKVESETEQKEQREREALQFLKNLQLITTDHEILAIASTVLHASGKLNDVPGIDKRRTDLLASVVAVHMVATPRYKNDLEITVMGRGDVDYFTTKVCNYLESFKDSSQFGWHAMHKGVDGEVLEIVDVGKRLIARMNIKCLALRKFDDALDYYAQKTNQSFQVMKCFSYISKVREALVNDGSLSSTINSLVIAILIITQGFKQLTLKVSSKEEAMKIARLVRSELDVFKDSPQHAFRNQITTEGSPTFGIETMNHSQRMIHFQYPSENPPETKEDRLALFDKASEIITKDSKLTKQPGISYMLSQLRTTLIEIEFNPDLLGDAWKMANYSGSLLSLSIAIVMVSQLPETLDISPIRLAILFQDVLQYMEFFKDTELFGWQEVSRDLGKDTFSIRNNATSKISTLCCVSPFVPEKVIVLREESPVDRFNRACDFFRKYKTNMIYEVGQLFDKIRSDLINSNLKEETLQGILKPTHHRQYVFRAFIAILMVSNVMTSFRTTHQDPKGFVKDVREFLEIFTRTKEFDFIVEDSLCENELIIKNQSQMVDLVVFPPSTTKRGKPVEEKLDVSDVIKGLSETYEEHLKVIGDENQHQMDAILQLCREKLKPGQYMELSVEDYPRLVRGTLVFGRFLRSNGYCLFSKGMGYNYMVTCLSETLSDSTTTPSSITDGMM